MSSVREHNEALNKAITEVPIELVKHLPIVGELVSGIERYKSHSKFEALNPIEEKWL